MRKKDRGKGLRVLRLGTNRLTGPLPRGLSSFLALKELDLSGNHLSGALPEWLTELRALEVPAEGPAPPQPPSFRTARMRAAAHAPFLSVACHRKMRRPWPLVEGTAAGASTPSLFLFFLSFPVVSLLLFRRRRLPRGAFSAPGAATRHCRCLT